jgi:hypothetical protein
MKKTNHLMTTWLSPLLIVFLLVTGSVFIWAQEPTPDSAESAPGEIFFVPEHKLHKMVDLTYIDTGIPPMPSIPLVIRGPYTFFTEVHFNSENDILAAYGLTITFDSTVATINTDEGTNGVSAGTDGFVSAVNATNPGELIVSGFDVNGKGPGLDLHIITIHWGAQTYEGSTVVTLIPDTLVDPDGNTIGSPLPVTGTITIETLSCILGDINDDGIVNIIDALIVAQCYVGICPPGYDLDCGDVDQSGTLDILDALLIAQYYVGIITSFPY